MCCIVLTRKGCLVCVDVGVSKFDKVKVLCEVGRDKNRSKVRLREDPSFLFQLIRRGEGTPLPGLIVNSF